MVDAVAQPDGDHLYCEDCEALRKKQNRWRKSEGGTYKLRDDTEYTDKCLFIGNLDYSSCTTDKDVRQIVTELWTERGPTTQEVKAPLVNSTKLKSCKPPVPPEFDHKRFAFVEFENVEDARATLELMTTEAITNGSRRLVAHPAVICGSGERITADSIIRRKQQLRQSAKATTASPP